MATFYFNGAAGVPEGAYYPVWTDLGNWWMDAAHTIPATALPTSSDDVIVAVDISMQVSGQTVANFTMLGNGGVLYGSETNMGGSLTVTGVAQFLNTSRPGGLELTAGSALFTNNSGLFSGAITLTSGVATFINSNLGDWYNSTLVDGDCVFISDDGNKWGVWGAGTVVNGNCTFSGDAISEGTINGTATFNDYSYNAGTVNYDTNYASPGAFSGATFNDSSYNIGTVIEEFSAVFNHLSNNRGFVTNGDFYDSSFNGTPVEPGTLQYSGEFYDSSYFDFGTVFVSSTPYVWFQARTPYPIPRGINGSSILGVI